MKEYIKEDLKAYRTLHMPLLQLMGLLALAGVSGALLVHWFL